MPPAPLPPNETARLAALHSYRVLDTESEEAFDDIVRLAAKLTNNPIALVSLVDAGRQWFKSRHGLGARETPRDLAFCAHAILRQDQPLLVPDATADPRFSDNALVTGAPHLRAYLGVPLVNADGHALGTLCVIDTLPKTHSEQAVEVMRTLARAVVANLELRRALRSAEEAALTDALTALPNRRALKAALADAIAAKSPVTVIAIDLDHFKETNDAEGHAAGDALLRATAVRLKRAIRAGDIVGRIGGDEFAAFLIGVDDREIGSEIAQRIGELLHQPVLHGTKSLRLGATLGVAIAPVDADEPELILRAADEAMIRAKRTGRGGVGWASRGDSERLVRSATIIRAFDADLGGADVLAGAAVHLQPIVPLGPASGDASERLVVEALGRWSHPDCGDVPPGELFALIGPARSARLGAVVRDKALAALAALRAAGLTNARVALNLSAGEVARADIAQQMAEQVERSGLSMQAVEIEITEEILLERVSDRTLDKLAALRGRGARLVLDDFGTGHSGLAQLLRMPLDAVKLDKRFIQRLGADPRAEEIVRATVSLAHSLRMHVVAEGVETERQAAMVGALGCDAAQGFFFARPMPPGMLGEWLRERALLTNGKLVPLRPRPSGAAAKLG